MCSKSSVGMKSLFFCHDHDAVNVIAVAKQYFVHMKIVVKVVSEWKITYFCHDHGVVRVLATAKQHMYINFLS